MKAFSEPGPLQLTIHFFFFKQFIKIIGSAFSFYDIQYPALDFLSVAYS